MDDVDRNRGHVQAAERPEDGLSAYDKRDPLVRAPHGAVPSFQQRSSPQQNAHSALFLRAAILIKTMS